MCDVLPWLTPIPLGLTMSAGFGDRLGMATPGHVRALRRVLDEALLDLLEDFDARQVLHVTFGSTLAEFRPRLLDLLRTNEETYSEDLERHFVRHLDPFAQPR